MKRTEPCSRLVRYGRISLGAFKLGPLAMSTLTPSSLGMQTAKVVFPSPGGPSSKMCPSGSPRFLDASMAICRTSITSRCPTISEMERGRRMASFSGGAALEADGPSDPNVNPGSGPVAPLASRSESSSSSGSGAEILRSRTMKNPFLFSKLLPSEATVYLLSAPVSSTAIKAFCGISTEPIDFIRFLPSRCFAHSFRFRVMSPP